MDSEEIQIDEEEMSGIGTLERSFQAVGEAQSSFNELCYFKKINV